MRLLHLGGGLTIGRLKLSTTLFLATAVAGRGFTLPSSVATATTKSGRNINRLVVVAKNMSTTNNEIVNVVFEEGKGPSQQVSVSTETSKDFLLNRPKGAYTTARTCSNAKRIFEWETHVERTANSLNSMILKQQQETSTTKPSFSLSDPFVLRRRLDNAVEQAVKLHQQQQKNANNNDSVTASLLEHVGELKITFLVGGWATTTTDEDGDESNKSSDDLDNNDGWVACHVTSLPSLPERPVRVEIRGSPRENALAKDSAWVSDRAPLEALMQSSTCGGPVNELLLANEQGQLLEGSQTNFYAVIDGKLWTAGEGILEGTVRGLVLDVCRKEGIQVVLQPPNVDTLESWEGALISSTSRLALPIDQLYMPEEGSPSGKEDLKRAFDNTDESSLAARIQHLVSLEVEARSTPIGKPVPT